MASTYSTWEYYSGPEYHGSLDYTQYVNFSAKAKYIIDQRTLNRAQTAPDTMLERLRDCECEIVDAMHGFSEAKAILPVGIASINNDGYSVSAGGSNTAGGMSNRLQVEESILREICIRYLTQPENLMYRGVRRRC